MLINQNFPKAHYSIRGKDLKRELQRDRKPQGNVDPSASRGIQRSQGCPEEITSASPQAPREGL